MLKDIGKKKYFVKNNESKNKINLLKRQNKSKEYISKQEDFISQEKMLENKSLINEENLIDLMLRKEKLLKL